MNGEHQGGWGEPVHGTDVTASFGYGSKDGQTLLGDGPNDNGTQRGQYTGYGS